MLNVTTQLLPPADSPAGQLLRAADEAARRPDAAACRLLGVVEADRRLQAATVTVAVTRTASCVFIAPLAHALVTGTALPAPAATALAAGALLALLLLLPGLVWRALQRAHHRSVRRKLHAAGVSASRDAAGWTLRDRASQRILAVVRRDSVSVFGASRRP